MLISYVDSVTHNNGYLDRDIKANNVYHSADKSDAKFKVSSKHYCIIVSMVLL